MTTSLLAYGLPTTTYGRNERWQLARWKHLTDCQMGAISQTDGQTTLTGHNFAWVIKNHLGQDSLVHYVVPKSQFRMAYSVVTSCDISSVLPGPGPDEGQLGSYRGDGVSCYPDPCTPIAVEQSTWGRIKARFGGAH